MCAQRAGNDATRADTPPSVHVYCSIILLFFASSSTGLSILDDSRGLDAAISRGDLKGVQQILFQNTESQITPEQGLNITLIAAAQGNLPVIENIVARKLLRPDKLHIYNGERMLAERIGKPAADNGHLNVVYYAVKMAAGFKCFNGFNEEIIRTAIQNCHKRDQTTLDSFVNLAEYWGTAKDPFIHREFVQLASSVNATELLTYLAEKRCTYFFKPASRMIVAFERNLVNRKFLECLEKNNYDLLKYIPWSSTAIYHLAARYGRLDVIQYMVEKDESILRKAEDDGYGYICAYGGTVVEIAADNGYADIVRYAVRKDPLVLVYKSWKHKRWYVRHYRQIRTTAFHLAIAKNFTDMDTLKYVIEKKGYPVTRADKFGGETIAHTAAQNGDMEILRYLVEKEPTVLTIANYDNDTVLHILVRNYNLSEGELSFFVDQGAPLTATNRRGKTVAHLAARSGRTDLVIYLTKKNPSILTIADQEGNTVLHLLAIKSAMNKKSLEFFVNKGASLMLENNRKENVALIAAKYGDLEILHFVTQKDPSVFVRNTSLGDAIVEIAATHGHLNILKFIAQKAPTLLAHKSVHTVFRLPYSSDISNTLKYLKASCEANITDWDRRHFESDVLREVLKYDYPDVLKSMEYDVNMKNDEGEPLIFTAMRRKSVRIFYCLAKNERTNLTALDREGNNILFIAAMDGDLVKMKYLLGTIKVPLDIEWRNNNYDSILHVAVQAAKAQFYRVDDCRKKRRDAIDVIKYLVEEKHANVNARGHQNETVLHSSWSRTNFYIPNYLLKHGADPNEKDTAGYDFWHMIHSPVR